MQKSAKAFSPAGISSFFEICDTAADGKAIADLERVGSRGGGFVLTKGVHTQVEVSEAKHNRVDVLIDKRLAPEAETTRTVAETLLSHTNKNYSVTINHCVEIPVGAGFGSSAGGALGTALALSKALDLKFTYNQLGRIAHVAEVKCKTGLGTVGPIMLGGCILTVEPGSPGIGVIDRLPLSPDYVVVAGVFGPKPTQQVLSSAEKRRDINRCGRKTLDAILAEPSLENFLECCWEFAEKAGFTTDRVRRLVQSAKQAGAVGAAQNMIGEAVHAVVLEENAADVAEAFKQVLPTEKVLMSRIDFQGARLVSEHETV
jgi:pantoate kinase